MSDVWSGLIKSAFFGLILTLTGCVRGYYTQRRRGRRRPGDHRSGRVARR